MKTTIIGGGPGGLYCGLLLKKANPAHDITIFERNPPDATYGWGVIFSDRTLSSFREADYKTYKDITDHFVIWDAIDTTYRGETMRCGGHVFAGISRKRLLNLLQRRCDELGVKLRFRVEISNLSEFADSDLIIAADGLNSIVRNTYAHIFKPTLEAGKAKYIWLGTDRLFEYFTFIFRENEHGLFQVHAYPFDGTTGTFIVECDEATWRNAGLDQASESESLAYCEQLFASELRGSHLMSNHSKWINFVTVKNQTWRHGNIVLLGDAAHTAHFSIGSGTKLAMEDAITLANALETHADLATALNEYEAERRPIVELLQQAAQESRTYFENVKRYLHFEPRQFVFHLLTRSGRVTYDDLRLRDSHFVETVDRWFAERTIENSRIGPPMGDSPPGSPTLGEVPGSGAYRVKFAPRPTQVEVSPPELGEIGRARSDGEPPNSLKLAPIGYSPQDWGTGGARGRRSAVIVAPPPMFMPLTLRGLTLSNRVVLPARAAYTADNGMPNDRHQAELNSRALAGAALVMTEPVAISAEGRITPGCVGLYCAEHVAAWAQIVDFIHANSAARVAIRLGHAGRRGSTRPRWEGLDRPLREANWPLISASPLPYTPQSQVPTELDRSGMDRVCGDFARSARMAHEAGFDLLQLHFAHGYLLASFLSPLTNRRSDDYGGSLENRLRFPLEVFDAVRAAWPPDKPISVALSATDWVKGGFDVDDAVVVARVLKAHGCDLIEVLAGQTTAEAEPVYGPGFLTPYSDRLRNEARIPTLVGGHMTTSGELNTVLAAGRADLCILDMPWLK